MKVLVLGKGFLGTTFEQLGYEVWGRDKYQIGDDLSFIKDYDVIINCIGISDTRWCEDPKNFRAIMNVNGDFPGLLSTACSMYNTKLVHISTGCLYDESHRPCTEEDFIVAHCNYTVSKYMGEKLCNINRDLIIRPRLLFSEYSWSKKNNLLSKLPNFNTYVDEFNSVTYTVTIVEAIERLLYNNQVGIFNVANEGIHTIGEIAKMIGFHGRLMTASQLRNETGLYLVNNVMSLNKLKQFYQPPTVEESIKMCWEKLNK